MTPENAVKIAEKISEIAKHNAILALAVSNDSGELARKSNEKLTKVEAELATLLVEGTNDK